MTDAKRAPEETGLPDAKRAHIDDVEKCFHKGLLDQTSQDELKTQIADSEPYKHGVIPQLIDDELLRSVRKEIMEGVHFTRKETDIYKVFQTGDLANLSGLSEEELGTLPSLFKLRNAMYSREFRHFMSYITGAGHLSGSKQDMSINVYQKSCHLLNHDDVIGTRRISYILYLPDPDEPWNPRWGGALRLFPTIRPNVPASDWTVSIPPAWNQMALFKIQPGLSFHDVEEVYVDKPRMSISGWFHIPDVGEEGYIEGEKEETEALSSLKQLTSKSLREHDFPKRTPGQVPEDEFTHLKEGPKDDDDLFLSEDDVKYLSKYLNPHLLTIKTVKQLNDLFCTNSQLEIKDFLNNEYASVLKKSIDAEDSRPPKEMPQVSEEIVLPWKLARPPHKARYMYLDGSEEADKEPEVGEEEVTVRPDENGGFEYSETVLSGLKDTDKAATTKVSEVAALFKSAALRRWISRISSLALKSENIIARRFRPGFDFTLATAQDESDIALEATLCLTPTKGWEDGEYGGYELCMAVDEDADDDPAVYRGAKAKEAGEGEDGDNEDDDEDDDEDDPVLLTSQASWNTLNIFVRDKGILKFVKYVSKNAPGSRWDISAEWQVEYVGDDEDEDDEDEEKTE